MGGTALYKFTGATEDGEPWSAVLKILYARPDEPISSPYYWKREYELYRSNLLENLPLKNFAPPTIYRLEEFPEGCWIWMEFVKKNDHHQWTLNDYEKVGHCLGLFNGAFLTGNSMPQEPWLSHFWHCAIIPPLADVFDNLEKHLEHPLNQTALPLEEKETILDLWQMRDRFREVLFKLPQTLCHYDAFNLNIFKSADRMMLIDWALVGRGVVGEELVCLIAVSLFYGENQSISYDQLDQAVFNAYILGLQDAGWQGDPNLARLGYLCGMVLRGLAGVKQDLLSLEDENSHAALKRNLKIDTLEEIATFFANIRRFRLIKMGKEALELLEKLGL